MIPQAVTIKHSEEESFANTNDETQDGVSAEILSLDEEANFCLGSVYWFGRTIPFNESYVFPCCKRVRRGV